VNIEKWIAKWSVPIERLTGYAREEVQRNKDALWRDVHEAAKVARAKAAVSGARGGLVTESMKSLENLQIKHGQKCIEQLGSLYKNALLPWQIDVNSWENYVEAEMEKLHLECESEVYKACERAHIVASAQVDTMVEQMSVISERVAFDTSVLLHSEQGALQNAVSRIIISRAAAIGLSALSGVIGFGLGLWAHHLEG
jgi:hypothetical protein